MSGKRFDKSDRRGGGKKRRGLPKAIKAIPISIAVAAMTTGMTAFADADYVQVQRGDGTYIQFDMSAYRSNDAYRDSVRQEVGEAWDAYRDIMVYDGVSAQWVDYTDAVGEAVDTAVQSGADAVADASIAAILEDPGRFPAIPSDNPVIPSPY